MKISLPKIASDPEPFHVQVYSNQEVNPTCGHLTAKEESENNCAQCHEMYNVDHRDWLKCPECGQWYHEECFYMG